mmetsp:Transcript_75391/g.218943  ORF Transcript_75391/g.218943 Transcript_75391/m.218943 type:complete len:382 (+) Transcript_75391:1118-2263(+)
MHEGGGHLHEVGTGQRGDHAHRVAVDAAAHGDDDDAPAGALRRRDGGEELRLAVGVGALEALARGMGKVESRATLRFNSAQDIAAVAEGVAGLTNSDHWEQGLPVEVPEELRKAFDAGVIPTLEGDHGQLQCADLKGRRLLLRGGRRLQWPPRCQSPLEDTVRRRPEDGGQGAPPHALWLLGEILEEPGARREPAQRVHVCRARRQEGHLHAAERQHSQDCGDRHLRLAALGRDEDQQARPVGPVDDHVACDPEERLVLPVHILGLQLRPCVGARLLTQGLRRARDCIRPAHDVRTAGGSDDVQGGELRRALRQRRLRQDLLDVEARAPVAPSLEVGHAWVSKHSFGPLMEQRAFVTGRQWLRVVRAEARRRRLRPRCNWC